jgi:hypothetical protein
LLTNDNKLALPRLWLLAVLKPFYLMEWLSKNKQTLNLGFLSVLLRFIVTTLTTGLLLFLLNRVPFAPSNLTFLATQNYYKAEMIFLPLWGIGIWLLMGSVAYLIIGLLGNRLQFDDILNIIDLGMLAPMPLLWIWDWTLIALNLHQAVIQAIAHSVAQSWEICVEAVGFKRVLGIRQGIAVAVAVIINFIYIGLAIILIR